MKLYCLLLIFIGSCFIGFSQQATDRNLIFKRVDSLIHILKEYKEVANVHEGEIRVRFLETDSLEGTKDGPLKNIIKCEIGVLDVCIYEAYYNAYYSIRDGKFLWSTKVEYD